MSSRGSSAIAAPTSLKPQTLQVLDDLRAAGPAGVHSFAFHARFIADPAKRVCELIALGYVIDRKPQRLTHDGARGTRYTLLSEPGQDGPPPVIQLPPKPGTGDVLERAKASRWVGMSDEGDWCGHWHKNLLTAIRCCRSWERLLRRKYGQRLDYHPQRVWAAPPEEQGVRERAALQAADRRRLKEAA